SVACTVRFSPGVLEPATYGRLSALQNQPPLAGCYSSQFKASRCISRPTDNFLCLAESVVEFVRRYFSAEPNWLLSLTLLLGLAPSLSILSGPGGRFGWF